MDERPTEELGVVAMEPGPLERDGYRPVMVRTTRGPLALRHYASLRPFAGVVWLGGVGGGWDTPARDMYPRLCRELLAEGVSSCRVRYRDPHSTTEALLDALVAVELLHQSGCARIATVGHSMGGAVAIQTALNARAVTTVVTLSTQSYGAAEAEDLSLAQSVLLVHGVEDEILPASCSRNIHTRVPGRKRLVLVPGARHGLDEAADAVATLVRDWLLLELGGDGLATGHWSV